MKGEIPSITNSATKASVNAVENKITIVSNFVTKTDYNTKFNDIKNTDNSHDKYVTILEFHRLSAEDFAARLKRVNLASKSVIANFVNKILILS